MNGIDLLLTLSLISQGASTPQTTPPPPAPADHQPPPASGGVPTVTDAAEMSAPGWLEFDPGALKDLVRDNAYQIPLTFKFTTENTHLQYLLGTDGYTFDNSLSKGWGNTYPGVHYLWLTQDKTGFDVAGKFVLTLPTAVRSIGGTGRADYAGYLLASRDFSKWGLHGDFNLGYSQTSRPSDPGYDQQALGSAAITAPIPGGLWQYTGELVYQTSYPGQPYRLTSMHGLAFAVKRYAIVSGGVQVAFHGGIPRYQLLLAASFNVAQLGK